jgi:hypothetical protein
MIAEFVSFAAPEGSTREDIVQGALDTVARWQANPALVRKHYLVSQDKRQLMGMYIWPSIEAAQQGHSPEWIAQTEARIGGKVSIAYYDLFMLLDNAAGSLTQYPA